ncbi:MAG: Crp/Fnr family transcriptional regulator [Candidatus Melainabacteria bacterium]|nr:Crp/Fnr family transcriptional regulator [Candidatus Melainabacteria bacterium]
MAISTSIINKIAQVSLFQDLGPAQLEEIALMCTRKMYQPQASIIITEDEEHSFYIISQGTVVVKAFDPTMREKVLAYLEPGDFFGEMAAIDSEPRSADVVAGNTEVEVLIFPQKDFQEILQNYPSVHLALSREFCRRLRLLNHRLSSVSLPASARIARSLILIANEHGKMTKEGLLLPKLTQSEIGKMSDSPRETVNRAFSELRDEGVIIPTESKQILIPSMEKIEEWIKTKSGIASSKF